ncbi:MAG: LysM peptidoglycan-binding domain-containing protein [Leptospiraceae bacterium]|nr:LysM peptidoglycan-binding domain-containing protein [Leptospiraceae bacterium]
MKYLNRMIIIVLLFGVYMPLYPQSKAQGDLKVLKEILEVLDIAYDPETGIESLNNDSAAEQFAGAVTIEALKQMLRDKSRQLKSANYETYALRYLLDQFIADPSLPMLRDIKEQSFYRIDQAAFALGSKDFVSQYQKSKAAARADQEQKEAERIAKEEQESQAGFNKQYENHDRNICINGYKTYTVQAGDNLYKIAVSQMKAGTRANMQKIADANGIKITTPLKLGQVLLIPCE